MSQHDQVIDNQAGAAFRSDLNNALAALWNLSSGATEPATRVAYMFWADTTTGVLKQRNAANSGWVSIGLMAAAGFGSDGVATVAAHATTCDIWTPGVSTIILSGSVVTFTNLAAAPAAGYSRRVRLNAAHVFTNGATFEVQGGATFTGADGTWVTIYAKTTTTFSVTIDKADGKAIAPHIAAEIAYSGSTNLSSANVEAALDELDAEKAAVSGGNATGTWPISISGNAATASNGGVTSVNGGTGAVTVSSTTVNSFSGAVTIVGGSDLLSTGETDILVTNSSGTLTIQKRFAGGGGGSSLHPDSTIAMADGSKKWLRDIRVGDMVKGDDGAAEVLGIWVNTLSERDLCEVNNVTCTPGHLFPTRSGGWAAVSPEAYKTSSYDKRRAVKGKQGLIDTHCLIADPDKVCVLVMGSEILNESGEWVPVTKIRSVKTKGSGLMVARHTQVIALHLDKGHSFYADGIAVATLA